MGIFSELTGFLRKRRSGRAQSNPAPAVAPVPKLTGFRIGTGGTGARARRVEHSRQLQASKKRAVGRKRMAFTAAGLGAFKPGLRPNFRGLRLSFRSRTLHVLLLLVVGVGASYAALQVSVQQDFWLVEEVSIVGQVTDSARRDFEGQAGVLVGQNIFSIDGGELTERLQDSPFIRAAYVRKRFPSRLEVELIEALPAVKLVSLSGLQVYDMQGDLISERQGEQVASLNEVERIMYTEDKPFKNEIVKQLWQQAQEESLREAFLRENTESAEVSQEGARTSLTRTTAVVTTTGAAPTSDEKWQEFVEEKFAQLPISAIAAYYNEARRTILFSVGEIWQANSKLVDLESAGISEIYSLVEVDPAAKSNLRRLVSSRAILTGLFTQLKDYKPSGMELISEFTFRLKLAETPQFLDNSYVYFTLRKDLAQQVAMLKLLVVELERAGRQVSKVDLSGDKVVVST